MFTEDPQLARYGSWRGFASENKGALRLLRQTRLPLAAATPVIETMPIFISAQASAYVNNGASSGVNILAGMIRIDKDLCADNQIEPGG